MSKAAQSTRNPVISTALREVWRNRSELGWALDLLRHGLCGDCSLGTHSWRDALLPGLHLCPARMDGLSRWTAGALDLKALEDVSGLSEFSLADLRALGRLPEPMLWRGGETGFRPLSWEDALKLAASRMTSARGSWGMGFNPGELSNEGMFCLSELASSGAASAIASPLTSLQQAASGLLRQHCGGDGATGSLEDLAGADLVLLAGCDLSCEPLLEAYLERVRAGGGRVADLTLGLELGTPPEVETGRVVILVGPGIASSPEPEAVLAALAAVLAAHRGAGLIPVGWPPGYRGASDLGLLADCPVPHPVSRGAGPGSDADRVLWLQAGSPCAAAPPPASFRIHLILDLDPSVLVAANEAVLLLPMQSRFEMEGGGTYTSLVGRVRFSPEIRGHQIGSSRPDWWAASQLLSRIEDGALAHENGDAVRRTLAQLRPVYAGVAGLFEAGESFDRGPA
jgi:anaerobic selenocysteine-containing dehydrogenase